MDLISKYLEKFKHIEDPKKSREKVALVINSFGFNLSTEEIKISKNKILISGTNPLIKNQLFLHKENILNALKKELPGLKIEEIK